MLWPNITQVSGKSETLNRREVLEGDELTMSGAGRDVSSE